MKDVFKEDDSKSEKNFQYRSSRATVKMQSFAKASLYIGDGKRDIYPKANIINNGRVLSTLKLQE